MSAEWAFDFFYQYMLLILKFWRQRLNYHLVYITQ